MKVALEPVVLYGPEEMEFEKTRVEALEARVEALEQDLDAAREKLYAARAELCRKRFANQDAGYRLKQGALK